MTVASPTEGVRVRGAGSTPAGVSLKGPGRGGPTQKHGVVARQSSARWASVNASERVNELTDGMVPLVQREPGEAEVGPYRKSQFNPSYAPSTA